MEVKKGMKKKYLEYIKLNLSWGREISTVDVLAGKGPTKEEYQGMSYNLFVIAAGEAVGGDLTAGKSPKQAEEWMGTLGLSLFQAGCVAQHITEFHPRGEEFRVWWNKRHGDGNPSSKGVVNPAVLEIKPKEKEVI